MHLCNICHNQKENTEYLAKEMKLGLRDEFLYFQCSNCGCLQIANIPDNISAYYEGYYAHKGLQQTEPFLLSYLRKQLFAFKLGSNNLIGKIMSKLNEDSFFWIRPNMFKLESNILDIGCGSGRLLLKMGNSGFQRLQGIDPYVEDTHLVTRNGKISIKKQDIFETNGVFDLIMMHHTLEHMEDQHKTFDKLTSLMHPKSKLLVVIPVIDSYAWDHYQIHAFQLGDAPRHFFLHSFKSFQYLAECHNLTIEHTGYYADMQVFVDSEKLKRGIALHQPIDFSNEEHAAFKKKLKEIKHNEQAGIAYFYLSLK